MELLIIKTGQHYIRVKPDGFLMVSLDKASVFPMDRLAHVRSLGEEIRSSGVKDIVIKKLVLSEEDL